MDLPVTVVPVHMPYASLCNGEQPEDAKFHTTKTKALARLKWTDGAYIEIPRGGRIYRWNDDKYYTEEDWEYNRSCVKCGEIVSGNLEKVLNRHEKDWNKVRMIHDECLREDFGYNCGGCDVIHLPNADGRAEAAKHYGLT